MTDEDRDFAIVGILGVLADLSGAIASLGAVSAHMVQGDVQQSAEDFQLFAARFQKTMEAHAALAEPFQGTSRPN